jgi:hypothetical protein
MPGDYSRKTFDPEKHYSGVLMQQGRVQLDADANEQLAIQLHRTRTEAEDEIGLCGVPKQVGGFKIEATPDGLDLTISPGRIYVGGQLCELEATALPITLVEGQPHQARVPTLMVDRRELQAGQWVRITAAQTADKVLQITSVDTGGNLLAFSTSLADLQDAGDAALHRLTTYATQPDYPHPDFTSALTSPPSSPPTSPPAGPNQLLLSDGAYLAFLDVWPREITALDDRRIREVALGGPDTTTRLKTVWQVKLLPVSAEMSSPPASPPASPPTSPPAGQVTCETTFPEFDQYTAPSTGTLNARTEPPQAQKDPCLLPPGAGYRGMENQLYRVELHNGGPASLATFKWSRENASVETTIVQFDGNTLTVTDTGKDEVLGFASGQWVEIVDEESTLKGAPRQLVQIDRVITQAPRQIVLTTPVTPVDQACNPKLRRWDQNGSGADANGIKLDAGNWLSLDPASGIQVQFSEGTYRSGDYWLIPARTATGDIEWPPYQVPNTDPIAQPPKGIHHAYCRLALIEVSGGHAQVTDDCRTLFPSLTDICADEVCFDNQQCQLPGAQTVQEALDFLCAFQDLRFHNKYLHGHGVVCGLKMKCGPNREEVVVGPGYALDCEGYGIQVQQELVRNLVHEAQVKGLLDEHGAGKVCVSISAGGGQVANLAVDKEVPKDFWETVLEGTLLQDFYKDCLEDLFILWGQNFPLNLTNMPDKPPVPLEQRRLTAFFNLLAQLINSASGPYIFLSGSKKRTDLCGSASDEPHSEDKLLWCFFQRLREALASQTFCAMFDHDRPFPDYEIDPGLATIFGPALKFHHRLRLHPTLPLAYTCGAQNKIYVYDLNKQELAQTLVFPASANVQVQDVAISPDGQALSAVALQDDKDSIFAAASIAANGTHTWGPTSMQCAAKFVRLAYGPAPGNLLYGLSKNQGLFQISSVGLPGFAATSVKAGNATGLLKISPEKHLAFIAVNDTTPSESATFTRILQIDLNAPAAALPSFTLQGEDGENDLVLLGDLLYVTGNPAPGKKALLRFNSTTGAQDQAIDLPRDTPTRLAFVTLKKTPLVAGPFVGMLVTMADDYKVVVVDLKKARLVPRYRIPVQLYPMDIVVDGKGQTAYVLNWIVNTITAINLEAAFGVKGFPNFTQEPPAVIKKYHQDVINACTDLMSHFLQHLKDCFCDKFLVDCPTCGEEDKVYLGCVEIRENRVYYICNFTKRRYVKSFQTWGYWLSVIPILPAIKTIFGQFCCSILDTKP